MKIVRFRAVLAMVIVLGIAGVIIVRQHTQIRHLKENRRRLAAQNQELSATNNSLLSVDAERSNDLVWQQQQDSKILSQWNQMRKQLAEATEARTSGTENSNELAGYVTKEQLKFAGLDTPENAFQTMEWAAMTGDYTNWLATQSPAFQAEESTNANSFEEFQHRSNSRVTGMQVLAAKPVGNDRVELKVRLDTENSVLVLIYPMVAVGNEWRLGDDIDDYSSSWDSPGGTP